MLNFVNYSVIKINMKFSSFLLNESLSKNLEMLEYTQATDIQEIAGKGLKGTAAGKSLLVGNKKLMEQFNITVPTETDRIVESIVMVGIDGQFAGYVTIADELKEQAMAVDRRASSFNNTFKDLLEAFRNLKKESRVAQANAVNATDLVNMAKAIEYKV